MRKDWSLIIIISLIVIVGLGLFGYFRLSKKQVSVSPEPSSEVAGVQEENTKETNSYFAEDAKIMYFYSDSCHWCVEEKKVLEELGKVGYKVKPMNVGENTDLWRQYNVSGTPTFIAANGERLVGYQTKDPLKKWLDEHK